MDILAVQQRVLDTDLVFNERAHRNGSSVRIMVRDVELFHTINQTRHDAWKKVAEWLDDREREECDQSGAYDDDPSV